MIKIALLLHITLALSSVLIAVQAVFAGYRQKIEQSDRHITRMWQSTIGAITSGFILSFIANAPLAKTCTSSLSLLAIILLAHYYQKYTKAKTGCPYLDQQ